MLAFLCFTSAREPSLFTALLAGIFSCSDSLVTTHRSCSVRPLLIKFSAQRRLVKAHFVSETFPGMTPQMITHSHCFPQNDPNTSFRGPHGRPEHWCGLCAKTGSKLSRCAACQVMRYCSREHQVEHRSAHKSTCNKIKKCRTQLEKEEHDVRTATPDFATPANAFETSVGHFWLIYSTRPYMRARFKLADTVRRLATLDGTFEALDHLQDMLRLCRSDNMSV